MKNTYSIFLIGIILFFVLFTSEAKAESSLTNKEEVMEFLGKAFDAQVSLKMQAMSLEDIEQELSPYFNREFTLAFLEDKLKGNNGNYYIYKSIYSNNFIPYFQYSSKTRVEIGEDEILVYDYHEPIQYKGVVYNGAYEGLLLRFINGNWLVTNELNDKAVKAIKKRKEKNFTRLIYMPYDSWIGQKTSKTNYSSKTKKPNIKKAMSPNKSLSQSISVYTF